MSDYREVVSNWWKTTVVGDFIEGTLVGKELVMSNDLNNPGQTKQQMRYEIKADAGVFHNLVKKGGVKVPDEENSVEVDKGDFYYFAKGFIDNAMKKIKVGQKVRLVFDSILESKDAAKNDFKLVKVYAGEMDQEYLKEQWGEVPTAAADEPAVPDKIDFNE